MDDVAYIMDFKTTKVGGCTILREDGSTFAVINSRYASNRQADSFEHEQRHASLNDFEKHNVQRIEKSAHL